MTSPSEADARSVPSPILAFGPDRVKWFEELAWQLQADAVAMVDHYRGSGQEEWQVAEMVGCHCRWLIEQIVGAVELGALAANATSEEQ